MLEKIKHLLKDIFINDSYGLDLESYIVSKNPQSTADVEYYTKEYDKRMLSGIWQK